MVEFDILIVARMARGDSREPMPPAVATLKPGLLFE